MTENLRVVRPVVKCPVNILILISGILRLVVGWMNGIECAVTANYRCPVGRTALLYRVVILQSSEQKVGILLRS